jgi:hypothetical protein
MSFCVIILIPQVFGFVIPYNPFNRLNPYPLSLLNDGFSARSGYYGNQIPLISPVNFQTANLQNSLNFQAAHIQARNNLNFQTANYLPELAARAGVYGNQIPLISPLNFQTANLQNNLNFQAANFQAANLRNNLNFQTAMLPNNLNYQSALSPCVKCGQVTSVSGPPPARIAPATPSSPLADPPPNTSGAPPAIGGASPNAPAAPPATQPDNGAAPDQPADGASPNTAADGTSPPTNDADPASP